MDFEFTAHAGERPVPLCMVAKELGTGRVVRAWRDELLTMPAPPFSTGSDCLFIAYYASAEVGCFIALGWPPPQRVLDLCVEFKRATYGVYMPGANRGLLGAMTYYGLGAIDAAEKEQMRELAMRGGAYTHDEQRSLLDYCQSDVEALTKLLPAMFGRGHLDLPRALLRGRYMVTAAMIEWTGVPLDAATLAEVRAGWSAIQDRLIAAVDADYGVYDGRTFKMDRFAEYLVRNNIAWPVLPSGTLDLSRDTFRSMAKVHPQLAPLGELRNSLSELRLNDLAVGGDGRNRCLLGAFGSRTGRNQPSNSKFIFGPATWVRGLMKLGPGRAIAYVDYEQQEFDIGGALSGDEAMKRAYASGDPYLEFAKQAGAVPADATKQSHKAERERFKVCSLAVQYGMGASSLSIQLRESEAKARELLRLHRQTYPVYWQWSDAAEVRAMLTNELHTVFGWAVHVGPDANPRSLRNFPLQGNGAEMLRLACCMITEAGIAVCAPVHDAILVEADADAIDGVVADVQRMMREASEVVLGGFGLRTEAKIVKFPGRYIDARGERMWHTVMKLVAELNRTRSTAATGDVAQPLPPLNLISSLIVRESLPVNLEPDRLSLSSWPKPSLAVALAPLHPQTSATRRTKRQFLKGPIDWPWLVAAGRLPGKAMQVAICLCRQAGLRKSQSVKFPFRRAQEMGMSRDSARRALRRMEQAGLVRLAQTPGRALVVTLVGAEVPKRRLASGE